MSYTVKALTLHQPWASLLALGLKHETRSWATSYRGPIAIHAAAQPTRKDLFAIEEPDVLFSIYAALQNNGLIPKCPKPVTLEYFINGNEALPLGCVIATGSLVECYKILGVCTPQ
ncbi:MAG: ASCH domain-containing protein [Oscillospiraceae bacterium]|nr:ASCH domain-containing protein [Oscillospiraceae bacterium]